MNDHYEQEIDLKWLLYRVMRAWRSIVLVALIAALAVGGIKFLINYSSFTNEAYRLQQEAAYAKAYADWEESTQQLRAELAMLQQSKTEQISYNENSILMQINPFHENLATFEIYVDCNELALANPSYSSFALSGRLLQLYQSYITGGELLQYVQDRLESKPDLRYVQELIVLKPNYSTNTLSCTISHIDAEHCQELALLVQEGLQAKKESLLSTVGMHDLIITAPSFVEQINTTLEKTQKNNLQIPTTLDTKLKELETSLSAAAAPVATHEQAPVIPALRNAAKYFLLAGVVAAFLMAVLIAGTCILSGKLLNPTDMKSRFGLHIIGQLPAARTKRPFAFVSRLISSIFGITTVPEDYSKLAKMVGSSIRSGLISREADTSKTSLAFTGTMNEDSLQSVIAASGLQDCVSLICAPDLLSNADSVEKISSADYVVLLVEQETTSLSDIEKMLEALKTWNKPVLGTVILNVDTLI